MTPHRPFVRMICRAGCIAALSLATVVFARQAPAAELAEHAHSLRLVPADVAYYSASLRLREQLDILLQSKAYARLMEIPVVQLGRMQAMFLWQQLDDPNIAMIRDYIESPQGQEALAVLGEMFSDEVFLAVDANAAQWITLMMELNAIQRMARIEAVALGEDPAEVMVERLREAFEERVEEAGIPTILLGFRIRDAERARRQLDEVHARLRDLLDEHQPEIAARLQREQVAGHEFLTLRLDGEMIPWDRIREEAEDEDELERWRELLSDKTFTVSLGVTEEFVLLSVAATTEHLETLGEGAVLADQPALARLQQHAGQRLVAIEYLSEAFARSMGTPEQTVEDLAGAAEEILQALEIDDEQRALIVADIRALDLGRYMARPGYAAAVAFLTQRGYERFRYSSGTRPTMDSSEPLTILNHAGGRPLLVVATRSRHTVEDHDALVAWLRQTAAHVEQIVEAHADPEDWAEYLKYRERGRELLRRLNRANRELLHPALADGQSALVVDVAATSERWIEAMPRSPKPLPMIEVGVVVGVTDAELLRKGVAEYVSVIQEAIALVREIRPDVPEFELPRPQKQELAIRGEMHTFPLPPEWGVDPQVAPNAALTDTVAAVSTFPAMSERLLQPLPLEVDTEIDLKRPAARAMHFNFAATIEAIRPWVDYGFDVAMGKLRHEDDESEEDAAQRAQMMMPMGFVVPQVHQFLNVATALRSTSRVTYEEDGVWVTHSETHLEDVK